MTFWMILGPNGEIMGTKTADNMFLGFLFFSPGDADAALPTLDVPAGSKVAQVLVTVQWTQ